MSRWHVSRREVLKGLGASIALPLLEAMTPPGMKTEKYFATQRPQRLAVFYFPNGVREDHWTPKGHGQNFTLSPILKPLEPYKKNLLVLGELKNKLVDVSGTDGHYSKTAPFLTCMAITKTTGSNINVHGTSVDQVMAQNLGHLTRFSSLEYGLDPVKGGVDELVGYTNLYGASISWESPTRPRPKEINPRFAFDRLFRQVVPGKNLKVESPWKKSVLDLVSEDARRLNKKLGANDQNKMSEYMESIRSVEKRIETPDNLEAFVAKIRPDMRKELVRLDVKLEDYVELASGVDITEKVELMMDINALALWCDASRVSTFMFGNSVSNRNFSFLPGVDGGHHSISHHRGHPNSIEMYGKINVWHSEKFAYFLERLSTMREGEYSVLDNSMVLFGSSLRDGDRHAASNLPIIIAGQGSGKLRTGQNLTFAKDTPLANLYLTLLQSIGIKTQQFGDSTGILPDILV